MAGESEVAQIYQAAVGCTEKEAHAAATAICRTPAVRDKLLSECGYYAGHTGTAMAGAAVGAVMMGAGAADPEPVTKVVLIAGGATLANKGINKYKNVSPHAKNFCKAYYRHSKIYDVAQLPGKWTKKLSDSFLDIKKLWEDPFSGTGEEIRRESSR